MQLINLKSIPSPCYVVIEELLEKNLKRLAYIQKNSGAKILLALKGYALCDTFPLIREYLHGISASGLWEAKLANEFFGKEIHTYCPAFREEEIDEISNISNHIIFNSFNQLKKFANRCTNNKLGIRINPEYSEISHNIYNPCQLGSRLGVTIALFDKEIKETPFLLNQISGLHFHTHCQQNVDVLERTLNVVEQKFGKYLKELEWINFGGGHHISRDDYDRDKLISIIKEFKNRYNNIDVYLEPSEAIGLNAGVLVGSVLDIIQNQMQVAILDISASNHMPDIIETSFEPKVSLAGKKGEFKYNYRFGGVSCLSGDVIGDYSFEKPLKVGDKVMFENMVIYSYVRNNIFNGVKLPSLGIWKKDNSFKLIKSFDYSYYKNKLC